MKGMMGAGLLAIPHGFSESGLVLGLVGFVVVGIICTFAIYLLIETTRAVRLIHPQQRIVNKPASFQDYDEESSVATRREEEEVNSINTYSEVALAVFGKPGEHFVHFLVIILEILFCTGFLIIICENVSALLPQNDLGQWENAIIVACLMPVLIGLSWIKSVKDMWFLSVFGFVVYVFGVILVTFIYGAVDPGPGMNEPKAYALWTTFPLFIGTAAYSLEGINLVLPILNAMNDSSQAHPVFLTGTMFYAFLVASYGAFGYMRGYGYSSCDIITNCLPPGVTLIIIRVALSLSLTATHTITLYPAVEMLEHLLISPTSAHRLAKQRGLSSVLVLLTGILTVAIGKQFGIFSSIVGSLMIPMVGFLIPVAMYIKMFKSTMSLPLWLGCSFTVMIGLCTMVTGTYSAIDTIISG
eukprot:TRINITY_DN15497_c0_g1_i1.p1 TRINITY_DN15497_c0_g1~~TRINITY_DN15497_c0_g1_i1.p1  ORF type:complete len:461 (-),score=74.04 TRINITY_DN15497_c0_g1_i1:44-1282(-)